MGIFDKLFGKKEKLMPTPKLIEEYKKFTKQKAVSQKEKKLLDTFAIIVANTPEPVRFKGKDLLPEFGRDRKPENFHTAMMCIIREGEKPSDVTKYCKQFIGKYLKKPIIFEDMDIYFHAFGKIRLPKDEENLLPIIAADKMLIEHVYAEGDDNYYGPLGNVSYQVITDHTNKTCCGYGAYKSRSSIRNF